MENTNFIFRENTLDKEVFDTIENEYPLPYLCNDDVVIDIGCHIGSFSYLCLEKGAGKVIGIEPFSENYELIKKNLGDFSNFEAINRAVWRSDLKEDLFYTYSVQENNTGGGHCLYKESVDRRGGNHKFGKLIEKVSTISLDELIEKYGKIRLLKIDCEFSEYAILLTSKLIKNVFEIVGEYHQISGNNWKIPKSLKFLNKTTLGIKDIEIYLRNNGFYITHQARNETLGIFRAVKEISCL